ncbi:MAG: thioredoxin-related protein [Arenicella sp.]|jgi:thioredoxin-related protein
MKKNAPIICLLIIALISSSFSPKEGEVSIQWMTMEEAFKATQSKPKKIFIDVYTDWCGWCKKMDKNTFENVEIANYMNTHFYAVKFNAEQKENIVLGEQTFKFVANGNRGYNELAPALMQGQMTFPTVIVLNEKFQMLQPIPGYREPKEMKTILEFFATNKHLQKPVEE